MLVTHDQQLAAHAQRRITLKDGLVIADETRMTATALKSPSARRAPLAASSCL